MEELGTRRPRSCKLLFMLIIGCGDNNSRNVPTLVKDVSNVGHVACGSSHTLCTSKDGCIVWSFGSGDNG